MCCIVPNKVYLCSVKGEMVEGMVNENSGKLTRYQPRHYDPLKKYSHEFFKKSTAMNIDNTASQMRKGVLEFCILSVIQQGEAYPSDIIDKMRAANLNIFEGTLYPLLTRLKNAELLTYRWVESNSGPPRKYFSLTEKGAAFYNELEATWNELANAVEALTGKE